MSVSSIIGGGVRLVRTQPQVVAIWGVLYFIATTLGALAMQPFIAEMAQVQQQRAANVAAGITTPPHLPGAAFGYLFLVEFMFAVLFVIAFAAVVRAVVRPTGDRFAYLRLGMDELRLIGLGFILAMIGLLLEIGVIIVLVIVVVGLRFVLGGTGAEVVAGIGAVVALCAAIYAEVRISLAGAFTVMEGRIVIREAWHATKGQFWTLFGAYLLLALIYGLITMVVLAISSPHLLAAYASFNMPAIQAATQEKYALQSSVLSVGFVVRQLIGAVIAAPLGAIFLGSVATAAFELSGARPIIAAQFD